MKRQTVVEKYKGKNLSLASIAKKISDKYGNRDTDAIQQRSFLAEMNELMRHQEMMKLKESAGKAIRGYRQPVEASSYAKKALGGGLDPMQMYNVGQQVGEFINYNNQPTDWDAQDPWAGTMMAQASAGQTVTPMLPTIPPKPVASTAPVNLPDVDFQQGGSKSKPFAGFEDWAKNNVFSPLVVGKGVEAVGKLAMLATGYDKTVPQYNPFESKIRQLMETRGIDLTQAKQDILSAENAAMGNLDTARSSNVRTALTQNLSNQTASNLARTSMQQQQIKSQQQGEYAQTLNNLGQQRVQAENYAEQLTQQSKGMYQMGLQGILSSVGEAGQSITNYRSNIAQQRLIAAVLQTKDFKLADPRGVLEAAIKGDEISTSDFYDLTQQAANGTLTQEQLDIELSKAKQNHTQRTKGLKS